MDKPVYLNLTFTYNLCVNNTKAKENELKLMERKTNSVSFDAYNKKDSFKKLRETLNERKYTVKETPVSYRVINHWGSNNILPEGVKDDGGWKKFNLIEVVWLYAASQMRDFGLSLEKISIVRNSVMDLDERGEKYPMFEFFIAEMTYSHTNPYIIIFGDGHVMLVRAEQIEQQKVIFGSQHMILISLKAILRQTEMAETVKDDIDALFLLSPGEKDLLEKLRFEDNSEVKTKIKNGTIVENEISVTTPGITPYRDAINKMKEKGAYGRVTIDFEDGVPKSVKKVTRRRFGK